MTYLTRQQKIIVLAGVAVLGGAFTWWLFGGGELAVSQWGSGTQATALPAGWERYEHPTYGFALALPGGTKVSTFREGLAGEMVYAKGPEVEFQVFVQPWDEPEYTVPTPERILRDLPDLKIDRPQEAILGDPSSASGQVRALIFEGEHPVMGKTREVWFIKRAHLFQTFSPYKHDQTLGKVFQTLTWK